ncbi:MAG: hypothetical protein QOK48_373 [Blastocatellia bacterium]|jgi:hypothetical protein|nr:hypothetical protein [Blastocatellia bacterium]
MNLDKVLKTIHARRWSALLVTGLFLCVFAWPAERSSAQTVSGSTDLVISQVYPRGGEPGAALRNDFIELFNRGSNNVNLADYSLVISTTGPGATADVTVSFVSSSSIVMVPGEYILFQLGSSGNNGSFSIISPEFSDSTINLGSTSGKIALTLSRSLGPLGCPVGQDPALADFVAYGPASCAEGAAPVAAPGTANLALVRRFGGCGDIDNNAADFNQAGPQPRNEFSVNAACTPSLVSNSIQFESNQVNAVEGQGSVEIFVTRIGDTSSAVTVQYATVSNQPNRQTGKATDRSDYTTSLGTLRFAAGETRKSFRVNITDDSYVDGPQSLTVRMGSPTGGVSLGGLSSMTIDIADNDGAVAGTNPVDASSFFVRQHYADFLGREPDTSGLNFWTSQIENCGTDANCRAIKRINVSGAFYLSIEFQETGFFVYRLFKASYPDNTARPRGFPSYREFFHDTQEIGRGVIVGQGSWQAQLDTNKQLAAVEFVERPEFKLRYPSTLTAAQFVDALNTNTAGALSVAERDALVNGLQGGTETRASVLRKVAEDDDFRAAQLNRAFVLMEYFGYLRRNPTELPDKDFTGFDFWLTKLNQFNGNFVQAQMVEAFITSSEYRARFGN